MSIKTWQERWKEYTCGDRPDVKQDCMQAEIDELRAKNLAQRKVLEQALVALVASTFYVDGGHPLSESDVERHEIITAIQKQL